MARRVGSATARSDSSISSSGIALALLPNVRDCVRSILHRLERHMDVIDSLEQTFVHAHTVIGGVRADQHGERTPCDEAAAAALAAWRTPGVLDRVIDAGPGPMPGRVLAG